MALTKAHNRMIEGAAVNVKDFGAVGDGVTDDTAAIQAALDSGATYVCGSQGDTYKTTSNINIPSNVIFDGNNATIKPSFASLGGLTDVLLISGSNTSGQEVSDVIIENWVIDATGSTTNVNFGFQSYGAPYTYKPSHLKFLNNKVINCPSGGVFISESTYVDVSGNNFDGGNRGVGTFEAIGGFGDLQKVVISNNTVKNTTQFGIQTYYGIDVTIANNLIEGSAAMTTGDRSCITVDRSRAVVVTGNICRNAPNDQIFVTGVRECSVVGNTCVGGVGGIQVAYNFEDGEDASIRESYYVTVTGNTINFNTTQPLILNGVRKSVVSSNVIRGATATYSMSIIDSTRSGDSVAMLTQDVSIMGNIGEAALQQSISNGDETTVVYMANDFSSYSGPGTDQIVLDKSFSVLRMGGMQIDEVGLIKRTGMAAGNVFMREARLADESYHKGFTERYSYGVIRYYDSAGTQAFAIDVGGGAGKKDIQTIKAGAGLVVTSPDGTQTKRIGIDNSGAIVATTP